MRDVRKKPESKNSHHFPNVYFQMTFSLPLASLLLKLAHSICAALGSENIRRLAVICSQLIYAHVVFIELRCLLDHVGFLTLKSLVLPTINSNTKIPRPKVPANLFMQEVMFGEAYIRWGIFVTKSIGIIYG